MLNVLLQLAARFSDTSSSLPQKLIFLPHVVCNYAKPVCLTFFCYSLTHSSTDKPIFQQIFDNPHSIQFGADVAACAILTKVCNFFTKHRHHKHFRWRCDLFFYFMLVSRVLVRNIELLAFSTSE